ncbi:hypothetical protein BST81_06635 [Leptolyngbya sp. 'hensonii']|nr:hypothetical protein BST81_06635 [Leptolyngbya sp. 'hensonii']
MTYQYSINQLQSQFDKIQTEIQLGNTIELTHLGQRIAVLISTENYDLWIRKKPNLWEAVRVHDWSRNGTNTSLCRWANCCDL